MELQRLRTEFDLQLKSAATLSAVDEVRVRFLGKKAEIFTAMQQLGSLPLDIRKERGLALNLLKTHLENSISLAKTDLEGKLLESNLRAEHIDVTLTARPYRLGGRHPISIAIADIKNIMSDLGFSEARGPEIEDDWHNFTALNIPKSHPARQMHDTFYFEGEEGMLLRTHTSSVQIRHMTQRQAPAKIFSIGRVYRADDDATHTPMFHQLESLCIDRNVTLAHLKYVLETFLQRFFELDKLPLRMRPSFFPFTAPSLEVDVQCDRSSKQSISLGRGDDWLEILGCGMVHPNVLRHMQVDPEVYRGFAFGIGVERLVMLKYNIPDLRTLFNGTPWN